MTWRGEPEPPAGPVAPGLRAWLRILRRALPILALLLLGALLMLICRVPERLLCGQRRPVTTFFPVPMARLSLALMGFRLRLIGVPMREAGAVVANHTSWADILALNARQQISFVAKQEVRSWTGIGQLAALAGTVFIRRSRSEAAGQRDLFRQMLAEGRRLLFFPEGTSTDGLRVLPFKSTLFDAFLGEGMAAMRIQPVSVTWHPPPGEAPGYYGWWGDMDFGANLLKVLATPRQGVLELTYHPPVLAAALGNRKALALVLGNTVRDGQALAGGRSA